MHGLPCSGPHYSVLLSWMITRDNRSITHSLSARLFTSASWAGTYIQSLHKSPPHTVRARLPQPWPHSLDSLWCGTYSVDQIQQLDCLISYLGAVSLCQSPCNCTDGKCTPPGGPLEKLHCSTESHTDPNWTLFVNSIKIINLAQVNSQLLQVYGKAEVILPTPDNKVHGLLQESMPIQRIQSA